MQPPWHWHLVSMRNGQCFHAQCSGTALFRSNVCPSLHWTTHSDLVVIGHLLSCSVHMGNGSCSEGTRPAQRLYLREISGSLRNEDMHEWTRTSEQSRGWSYCLYWHSPVSTLTGIEAQAQTGKVVHYSLLVFIISAVVTFTGFLSSVWTNEGCQKNSTHIWGQK